MTLRDVDAPIFGWTLLPIIGKRDMVRLECPHCKVTIEVRRNDISKQEDGQYVFKKLGDAEAHPWTHRIGRGTSSARAVRAVAEVLDALMETKRSGDPEHIRGILAMLADAVRPFAPEAADALAAPVLREEARSS